ncbi:MAG: nuclear transport factor 2 family protein [Ferruginibacter sp.]
MKNIIREYLNGLESGDPEQMTRLFSDNAVIHSPLYGDVPAKDFYKILFADTNRSEIKLLNIFNSTDKKGLYVVHFRYDWILRNGIKTSFECIDIFQFDEQGKINELSIIYDTSKTRDGFEGLG